MPKRSDLPKNASKLLALFCALSEEAQYALLALLQSQETASLGTRGPDLDKLPAPQEADKNNTSRNSPENSQQRPLAAFPLQSMQVPDARGYLKLQQRVRELEATVSHLKTLITREEWLPRQQFLQRYPSISEGQLKHLLLEREHNGLMESGALRQNGPRSPIFICPARFWQWFEEG